MGDITKVVEAVVAQQSEKLAQITSVFDQAKAIRSEIDTSIGKALAAASAIKKVDTAEEDDFANKLLVKLRNTVSTVEAKRKSITSVVRDWLSDFITPENKLKLEIGRIVELRDSRADRIKKEADAAQAQINADLARKNYRVDRKKAIQQSILDNVGQRVFDLQTSIEKAVGVMTIETAAAIETKLKGIKFKLKEDYYLTLLDIGYDTKLMTQAEYDDLLKGAKGYFTYESVDENYRQTCTEVRDKWVASLPGKIEELKRLAKGGEEAKRLQSEIDARNKKEREEFDRAALQRREADQKAAAQAAEAEKTRNDFEAQARTQALDGSAPKGTRTIGFYQIDEPENLVKVAAIIQKIILFQIPENADDLKNGRKKKDVVVERYADGTVKHDPKTDGPVYTAGVQFFLDMLASMPYQPDIPGLTHKQRLATTAKA